MRIVRGVASLGVLLAWATGAFAQQSIDLGSLTGRVLDPSGAAVPGARIEARQLDTGVTSDAITDAEGRFRIPYLRIGRHDIIAALDGFQTTKLGVTISAGSAFDVSITLALATIDASVTVTARTPVLETARSQVAGAINATDAARLPLNGRNYLDIALMIPGVAPANISSTQLFPETSAVPGVTLSIGSQRNLSNNFIVDGLSGNDDAAGLSGMTFSLDALEEVQVVTSGGQAELGRALGGYMSIVTRSGTNALDGTGFLVTRDDRLNAKNALIDRRLPMQQWQYGASLGGPIARNRTFFFLNGEHRRLDQSGLVTISDANVAAINARLAATGYSGPAVATGIYENPVRTSNLLAKIDHQIASRGRIGLRYSLYDATAENARGVGGLSAPSASSGLDNRDHALAFHSTLTLSSRTVLETRAQWAHGDLEAAPSAAAGPTVSIAGVATFGTLSTSPLSRVNTQYQVVNNLSHHAGAHALRAGIDVLYNDDVIAFPRTLRGGYSFGSLAAFLAGTYANAGFAQTFGDSTVAQTNPNVGIYLQDEWRAAHGLTLNLGLRYDLQFLETIETDRNNVAPRAGFVWTPRDGSRWLVRGGAGLFFDRVPLRALANALLSAGNTTDIAQLRQVAVQLSPGQALSPAFPNILNAPVPSVTLPNLTTMDRHLQNAYSRQGNIEVERQLTETASASVSYQHVNGRNLLVAINQNVPTCLPAGSNNGCRPISSYANNSQYTGAGRSTYHGLSVSIAGRPSARSSYRVSYTLSKAMNDTGEFFFSGPIDPTDISKDWGRSDNDQRHRFVAFASLRLPFAIDASTTLQAYSAPPFNITSGATTIHGTPGRPIVDGAFIERNAGEGSPFLSVNARLARSVDIAGADVQLTLEAFNVTNHRNVVTRNTTFGTGAYPGSPSASFGQITAIGEPRALQLGLRVRFK